MGISGTTTTLSVDDILSNISKDKGPALMTKCFHTREITAYAEIIEKLLIHNMLSPKSILEEFGTEKCDELFHNIKSQNWPISAADKIFYPSASETLFKHCTLVRHGMFPDDFQGIVPGHHLYPHNPAKYIGFEAIMLQKNTATGNNLLNTIDMLYLANAETHIFKEIYR